MNNSSKVTVNVGPGVSIPFLAGVVFVVLKLTGVIGWSWWLVTLPFWAGAVLCAVVGLVMLAAFGFAVVGARRRDRSRRVALRALDLRDRGRVGRN